MNRLSDRINALAPSATLAMSQKSSELRAQGVDVINLSVGEPDFFTPDHIKAAAKQAVDDNFSFYSPVPGYLSLRQAVCEKLRRENGLEYTPDQIVIGNGAKHELCNAIMALINPDDEVIIPTPAWVSYVQMVNLAGGKSVLLTSSMEKNFKVTAEELEAAMTDKTRLIIICSPSNPSGAIYNYEELKAIAAMLERHPDVMVIADEIYEHINYVGKHESLAQFGAIKEQVVIINGGYRIGYIAAPLWVAKAVNKMQGQYTSGVSSIAQKAAEAAYNGPQDCVEEMRVAFERRRNLIVGLLQEIPGFELNMPDGAFYAFPKVEHYYGKKCGETVINDDNDLALYLLNEAHVATVAGSAFCCPGYIRLSYATSDENLIEAAKRIAAALAKLA